MEAIDTVTGSWARSHVTAPGDVLFGQFYTSTWPDVVAYCTGLLADRSAGEELAQEAFVRLYPRFGRLDDPRPYVFRIAGNLCRRHLRFRRSVDTVGLGSRDDRTATDDITRVLVDSALRRLRRTQREVVLLHYFADLSVAEISRVLLRPEGTVKRQLHTARGELARLLGNGREGGSDGSR